MRSPCLNCMERTKIAADCRVLCPVLAAFKVYLMKGEARFEFIHKASDIQDDGYRLLIY